jgi:hypothetical protein
MKINREGTRDSEINELNYRPLRCINTEQCIMRQDCYKRKEKCIYNTINEVLPHMGVNFGK